MAATPEEVLTFWFDETPPKQRWAKDPDFDRVCRVRFGETHARAAACDLFAWRRTARGRLAEIIVLDQFSRNMFRDTPAAFAQDALALALAQEAVAAGAHRALDSEARGFLYMPFMHSESLAVHDAALPLFREIGDEDKLRFELRHREIIERFGRYPHRNAVLGRASTPEELDFLKTPGSGF